MITAIKYKGSLKIIGSESELVELSSISDLVCRVLFMLIPFVMAWIYLFWH